MKKVGSVMLLFLAATLLPGALRPRPAAKVTVFAAASLADAFKTMERGFNRANPGTQVMFNFAGSQQLAAQLEQGARGDVFATADQRWMSYVRAKSLIDGSPVTFARNSLVVIYPRSNPAQLRRLGDLARRGTKLVMAAEAVPVGSYSREMLQNLGRAEEFSADYAARVLANVVSYEESVKGVVAKVQLGEADAGVVYRSEVTPEVARFVSILEIPGEFNILATYSIATVRGATSSVGAYRFIDFVQSAEGQRILRQHGFHPPASRP
jgi:molybdate transport system substrate-binding protein